MQRISNEDAGLRTKSFRVIVRTSDLVNTPVQNQFVSQFRLRILDQYTLLENIQCKIISSIRTSDLGNQSSGSWKQLQGNISCHRSDFGSWIKTPVDLETNSSAKSFRVTVRTSDMGRVTVRTSDLGSKLYSASWNKLLCNIISCHCSDFMLDTKSSVKLSRITVWTSDLGCFHRFDFRYWIKTPVDLGKTLQRTMFSCHSSDFGS